MMVSSELKNDLDALSKKIDDALTFPNQCLVVDGATEKSNLESNSCVEFLEELEKKREVFVEKTSKFLFPEKKISSIYPSYEEIPKSKILEDEELFDAILFSKIFEDESEYASNYDQYQGEMVWVEMDVSNFYYYHDTALIYENRIIYGANRETIDLIREDCKNYLAFFKKRIKKNLIESLSVPASIPDTTEYVSDLKSSFDAAVTTNGPSNPHQNMAPMTEDTKKILLAELCSLNVDPRFKQLFEFDLKLLAYRDVYYWRDRLDALRCSAAGGSPQSSEVEQLRQKVAELEKLTASQHDGNDWVSNFTEKISKLEERVSQNESRLNTSTDMLSKMQIDASLIAECKNTNEGTRKNAEKLLELEEEFSSLQETVELLESRWKTLNVKVEMMNTSAFRSNTIWEMKSQKFENSAGVERRFERREIWKLRVKVAIITIIYFSVCYAIFSILDMI